MKIVKPINVTDEILIDSSIPMPDTARGEDEWQNEDARSIDFERQVATNERLAALNVGNLTLDGSIGFDSIFIEGSSANGWVMTWSLQQSDVASKPLGLSGWSLGSVMVDSDLALLSFFKFDNTKPSEKMDIRIEGESIVASSLEVMPTEVSTGLYDEKNFSDFSVVNLGQSLVVSRPDGVLDLVSLDGALIKSIQTQHKYTLSIANGLIYACAESSRLTAQGRRSVVHVYNTDLNLISTFDFSSPSATGSLFISSTSEKITITTNNSNSKHRNYDKNMINIGSYKRNDEVIKSSTKRKYRCAVGATFDDPELGVKLSPPTWVDIGSVNRWMPFDKQPAQQAVSDSPMFYKLKPGEFVRTLSIFNISRVTSINVKVTDPVDGVIYDKEFDLADNSNVVDMWTYLTLPITFKKELIITDLVCFRGSEVEITINGNDPAVGAIVTGNESPAGRCVTGTGVRSNQFSIRKENGFGGFDIIQRGVGKIVRFRVAYDISQIDYLTNLLESIDSVYCVFIGDLPNGKAISVYGVLDPYQSDFETPTVNTLEFDALGVL